MLAVQRPIVYACIVDMGRGRTIMDDVVLYFLLPDNVQAFRLIDGPHAGEAR